MTIQKIVIASLLSISYLMNTANASSQGFSDDNSTILNKPSNDTINIVDIFGKGTGSYNPDESKITVCTQYSNVIKISAEDAKGFTPPKGLVPCGKTTDLKFIFYGKPVEVETNVNRGKIVKKDPRY